MYFIVPCAFGQGTILESRQVIVAPISVPVYVTVLETNHHRNLLTSMTDALYLIAIMQFLTSAR